LGYYWGCNQSQDNTIDNWGMLNRECVSYTAFRMHQAYLAGEIRHDMPNWGGVGNAYQWIQDAQNAGIPVDQTPQAGDIAIRPRNPNIYGDVGHAMYVESVVDGGTIIVSQYNSDYHGTYSMVSRSSAGLYFLHFSQW
jgi:surface antigen